MDFTPVYCPSTIRPSRRGMVRFARAASCGLGVVERDGGTEGLRDGGTERRGEGEAVGASRGLQAHCLARLTKV